MSDRRRPRIGRRMDADIGEALRKGRARGRSSALPDSVMVSTTTRPRSERRRGRPQRGSRREVDDSTVISRAPAPNTISASRSPPSTVLVSARIGMSGQSSRAVAIAPMPKRLRSGVPISTMSAIPRTCVITPTLFRVVDRNLQQHPARSPIAARSSRHKAELERWRRRCNWRASRSLRDLAAVSKGRSPGLTSRSRAP